MSLSISVSRVVPEKSHFPDLTVKGADTRSEKVASFIERFKHTAWRQLSFPGVSFDEKTLIHITLPLVFLTTLVSTPLEGLSFQEESILKASKSFEKKTRFFLATPGGLILVAAALASTAASALGYYYGIKPPQDLELSQMVALIALAAGVGAIASNMLGFYITGTLPNNASEADNKEQNMWDMFRVLKTEPTAYQLLEWFSPVARRDESPQQFEARRKLAKAFVTNLDIDRVVLSYKTIATQPEKIDEAFRPLYVIKELIESQIKHEMLETKVYIPLSGNLAVAAKLLGYFS